jgi:hypothetical protein
MPSSVGVCATELTSIMGKFCIEVQNSKLLKCRKGEAGLGGQATKLRGALC